MPSPQLTLSQRFFFDAAHTLRREIESEGSRRIHGHTYHAEVSVRGPLDPATGMVIDLGLLRERLQAVREQLDHHLLDDVPAWASRPWRTSACSSPMRWPTCGRRLRGCASGAMRWAMNACSSSAPEKV